MTELEVCPACDEHGVVKPSKDEKSRPYCLRCGWMESFDLEFTNNTVHPAFTRWWNDDELSNTNPYWKGTPAYWAWEGWSAAFRYLYNPDKP